MSNYISSHTGTQIDTCVNTYQNAQQVQAAIDAAKLAMFPVGSIYISTNGTNPSTFIGGTWVAFATGRTIIGAGTGTDSAGLERTFTSGATDGEYEHTLDVTEMPSHRHWISGMAWDDGNCTGSTGNGQDFGVASDAGSYTVYDQCKSNGRYDAWAGGEAAGGASGKGSGNTAYSNSAHNNLPPYITVYMWKRTA